MAFLKQSRDWTRCEQCRVHFNLVEGGVCRSCGRILCETHLYGSWVQRLRRYVGMRATCVDCRTRPPLSGDRHPANAASAPGGDASQHSRSG